MGHKFRTAKVFRTCSILEAKFLTTWTTVYAGKLFLKFSERVEFDRDQVFYLSFCFSFLPDATECFQLTIHTAENGQQRTIPDSVEIVCSFVVFSCQSQS